MAKQKPNEYVVLSPTEELIIKELSHSKFASISDLSKKIGLARTSIYNGIHKLIKKEIVSRVDYNYFMTNRSLKKKQEKRQSDILNIENLMDQILNLKSGEIIYSIESDEEIVELFKDNYKLLEWQKSITDKGIVLKGIGSKQALTHFRSKLNSKLRQEIQKRSGSARFTDDKIPGYCTVISFRNTVVFMSRKKRFFYKIESDYVSNFLQFIIDTLYSSLEYKPLL